MEKELNEIRDFVKSLEINALNKEQQAVLLVGEDNVYGCGKNKITCENTLNDGCANTGSCSYSNNTLNCNNTGYCNNTNNNTTCTGGSSSGGSSGGGSGAAGYGMLGFPGFGF